MTFKGTFFAISVGKDMDFEKNIRLVDLFTSIIFWVLETRDSCPVGELL